MDIFIAILVGASLGLTISIAIINIIDSQT